jgi:hypothetical protein
MSIRKAWPLIAAGLLPAFGGGCRGQETTASRSAAAYDEARRKGTPVQTGQGHGQHAEVRSDKEPAVEAAGPHGAEAQHAGHGGDARGSAADRSPMPGMDHSRMGGTPPAAGHAGHTGTAGIKHPPAHTRASGGAAREHGGMAGMDHSRMDHSRAAGPPAGHGAHAAPAAGGTPSRPGSATAGMDHSKMPDHSGMAPAPGMAMPPPRPEPASATATPGQPAATLRRDALDGPASTSAGDAARSAAIAAEMAAGGHAMQHGTYTQTDAGRDSVAPAPGAGHEGHPAAPPSRPRPSPSPRNEDHR